MSIEKTRHSASLFINHNRTLGDENTNKLLYCIHLKNNNKTSRR